MDDPQMHETAAILRTIPGGNALLDWFRGPPEFGDAEVIELRLDRAGTSLLRLALTGRDGGPAITCTFHLKDMVDVTLQGFSHQNVVRGLYLRHAAKGDVHPTLRGVGLVYADHEIELEPLAGAFGLIRATIERVALSS